MIPLYFGYDTKHTKLHIYFFEKDDERYAYSEKKLKDLKKSSDNAGDIKVYLHFIGDSFKKEEIKSFGFRFGFHVQFDRVATVFKKDKESLTICPNVRHVCYEADYGKECLIDFSEGPQSYNLLKTENLVSLRVFDRKVGDYLKEDNYFVDKVGSLFFVESGIISRAEEGRYVLLMAVDDNLLRKNT